LGFSLIQAIIHPEWATETIITTLWDNENKKIHYYQDIEEAKMKAEFFEKVNAFLEE